MSSWYRLYKFVPGQNEIGENEKYGSKGEQAAALEHCCHHHYAYEGSIYAYSDTDYSGRSLRCNSGKSHCQECQGAENHH